MSDTYRPPLRSIPALGSGLAIGSLISGILGRVLVAGLGSVVGLTLGYVAPGRIRESGGAIGGEGLAKGGIIVSWVGLGLWAVAACVLLFISATGGGICACASLGMGNSIY